MLLELMDFQNVCEHLISFGCSDILKSCEREFKFVYDNGEVVTKCGDPQLVEELKCYSEIMAVMLKYNYTVEQAVRHLIRNIVTMLCDGLPKRFYNHNTTMSIMYDDQFKEICGMPVNVSRVKYSLGDDTYTQEVFDLDRRFSYEDSMNIDVVYLFNIFVSMGGELYED